MNIGNVSGNGGVDRSANAPSRADGRRPTAPAVGSSDAASISSDSRDAAAAFETRVATAAAHDPERADSVARAVQRLMAGELDREPVLRATAERLLGSDFRAV